MLTDILKLIDEKGKTLNGINPDQIFSAIVGLSDKLKLSQMKGIKATDKIYYFLKLYLANYKTIRRK
jgi:hypothetical protein